MADDGMFLNFDLGNGVIAAAPQFKGGKWKERAKLKRTAAYHASSRPPKNPSHPKNPNHVPVARRRRESANSDTETGERDAKRQRTAGPSAPRTDAPAGVGHGQQAARKPADGGPKQVISSLFTYNPKSTYKEEPQSEPVPAAEPSNAPLTSELDTFTSLGLSTKLANHLLTKMELKAPTAIQKSAISQLLKEDSDAFVQAETGSGKTLAYLLPIVQRIIKLAEEIAKEERRGVKEVANRKSGLFAIILAPTRELSKQIQVVLDSLLRCATWIVSGIVIGGEKKQSEKARIRKGVNILVATPGRLADHLQHTEALDVSCVRWLVLDEGDRLMELGFENDIQKIVGLLNLRLKAGAGRSVPGLPEKRTTILCSATMKIDVERLGEISLKDAVHIQKDLDEDNADGEVADGEPEFSAPAQLQQSYVIVPAKLRLVSLIAFLKRAFERKGSVMKAVVFISCADSVDFHFDILTRDAQGKAAAPPAIEEKTKVDKQEVEPKEPGSDSAEEQENATPKEDDKKKQKKPKYKQPAIDPSIITCALSSLITSKDNEVTAYRLHGSLTQAIRTSTLNHYARSKTPSVLLATDVASRGLDLPNVDLVLEYDPAFARDDHLHRIGRTARAGRDGRSSIFLMPGCEEKYIAVLNRDKLGSEGSRHLVRHTAEDLLKRAFTPNKPQASKSRGEGALWENAATELQLQVERTVQDESNTALFESAKRAFQGHVRAYATHVSAERECFDIKELHLGHLAKAFALRERPGGLGGLERRVGSKGGKKERGAVQGGKTGDGKKAEADSAEPVDEIAAKMRKMVRQSRRMGAGADEFNIG